MKTRLDETPYVGRRADGSLHLAESLGPVLDIHCHLALTYVPTGQVDLEAEAVGDLYLDFEKPLDLEPYLNTQFDRREMAAMRMDLSLQSVLPRGGKRVTHTGPALVRSMNEIGVTRSVILAIDLPFSSRNTGASTSSRRGSKLCVVDRMAAISWSSCWSSFRDVRVCGVMKCSSLEWSQNGPMGDCPSVLCVRSATSPAPTPCALC